MTSSAITFHDKTGTALQLGDLVQLHTANTYEQPALYLIDNRAGALAICLPDSTESANSPAVKLTTEIAHQLIIVGRT